MFSVNKLKWQTIVTVFAIISLSCSKGFPDDKNQELKRHFSMIDRQPHNDVNSLRGLETEYLKLLKDYNSPEDKGKIYSQIAIVYSGRGYPSGKKDARIPKAIEYCRKALEEPLDALTACRMYEAWAGTLMVKYSDSNDAEWAKMRQEAIILCLKGLKIAMDNNAPAEHQGPPPRETLFTADGPDYAKLVKEFDKKHQKEVAARNEWDLKQKFYFERKALTELCVGLYEHKAYNTKELQDFAERELKDYPDVRKELLAKVESGIKEKTPQNSPSK